MAEVARDGVTADGIAEVAGDGVTGAAGVSGD
jgi:hypothetical protein